MSSEIERAWEEEAERRYQRYLAGEIDTMPAADVLAEIRAEYDSTAVTERLNQVHAPEPDRLDDRLRRAQRQSLGNDCG